MGIFTSLKRRTEDAAQARLMQAQANVNRLRIFLPAIAAGLDSNGHHFAQHAIGMFVAIVGWPSLAVFVYQLGSLEADVAKITSEDEGRIMDRVFADVPTQMLLKVYAQPMTLDDIRDMQTIACMLMVWWGFGSAAEEPKHPVVRLMQHFGGYPFASSNVEAIQSRFDHIRVRITPEANKMWKQAEQAMKTCGNGLLTAS